MAVVVLKLLFILKSILLVPNSSPFSEKELFIPQYFFFHIAISTVMGILHLKEISVEMWIMQIEVEQILTF